MKVYKLTTRQEHILQTDEGVYRRNYAGIWTNIAHAVPVPQWRERELDKALRRKLEDMY